MSTEWRCQIDYPPTDLDNNTLASITEQLTGFAILTAAPTATRIDITVKADTAAGATARAVAAIEAAWHGPEPIAIRVTTAEAAEREAANPAPIDLLGITDIANRLGITRQRADELTRTAAFPDALGATSSGRVWTAESIDRFEAHWERKPGRPSKRQ